MRRAETVLFVFDVAPERAVVAERTARDVDARDDVAFAVVVAVRAATARPVVVFARPGAVRDVVAGTARDDAERVVVFRAATTDAAGATGVVARNSSSDCVASSTSATSSAA